MKDVKAIQEGTWPLIHDELRSLLGLANYYHRFIRDFSKVARTLFNLLKKWLSQQWDETSHQAFGELKSKLFSPPMIRFAEFDKPFEVHTGASYLPLADVDARWMAIVYKNIKLDGCPTLSGLQKKWLSQKWDDPCHPVFGELQGKLFLPPVLKFSRFDKPFGGAHRGK